MSESASFQSARKAWYALFALVLSPDKVYALPSCRYASAPMGPDKGLTEAERLFRAMFVNE